MHYRDNIEYCDILTHDEVILIPPIPSSQVLVPEVEKMDLGTHCDVMNKHHFRIQNGIVGTMTRYEFTVTVVALLQNLILSFPFP